jgi:hypothetical protein
MAGGCSSAPSFAQGRLHRLCFISTACNLNVRQRTRCCSRRDTWDEVDSMSVPPDSRPMLPTRPCPQRKSWIDRRTRVCPLRANLETPVMLYWGAIPLRRTGAAPQSVRLRQREQHWEQAGWWVVASISINEVITVPGGAPRGGGWWHSPCVTNRSQVAACRATARLTSLC